MIAVFKKSEKILLLWQKNPKKTENLKNFDKYAEKFVKQA